MTSMKQAVERAVDDIIVELSTVDTADVGHWKRIEAAATRLRKAARELRQNEERGPQ